MKRTRVNTTEIVGKRQRFVHAKGLGAAFSALLGLANGSVLAFTIDAHWVPDDIVVSNPGTSMSDPEFDPVTGYTAWQFGPNARLKSGRLLVAQIDPLDGDLLDPTTGTPLRLGGRGQEVDRDLVSRELTANGPEFAYAEGGSRLLYTKSNEFGEPSIGQAIFDGVNWNPELLIGGENRITPEGSKELGDSAPRVAYFGFVPEGSGVQRRLGVRLIDFAFTERIAPDMTFDGASFLPGEPAMLATSVPEGGNRQIFNYNYDENQVTQITTGPSVKMQSPEIWSAPELNDETLFTVGEQVNGESLARVYRRNEVGDWTIYLEVRSPDPDKPFLSTPFPFVYEGVSYLSFRARIKSGLNYRSDIWVVNLAQDPLDRTYRMVSEPGDSSRYDQEVYITDTGPVVYYTELLPNGFQRIRRCKTGIESGAIPLLN